MRVADTSVIYAFFDAEDAHHARAVENVSDETPILVPSEIVVEFANLAQLRFGFPAASESVGALLGMPHVSLAPRVSFQAARAIFEAAKGKLSLADAIVVQTCVETGATALTFDAALARRARSAA